eukprot:m.14085 g.14085  ORF g.14085 m.14085 type:complete len:373 (+) comp4726_c0_seq1:236-1354(+)
MSTTVSFSSPAASADRKQTVDLTSALKQSRALSAKSRIEGMSHGQDFPVIAGNIAHGFVQAGLTAFDGHHPFSFSADHVWLMVLQAVAQHVNANSDELRHNFVTFEGKETLVVHRDEFVLGSPRNDWAGVAIEFGEQIAAKTVEGTVEMTDATFSTTSPVDFVASRVTLMDICQSFFEFRVMTCCGFPAVTLEGTLEDWKQLRARTEALLTAKCKSEFVSSWGKALFPLLDKFIAAYEGESDATFWNAMVKRGGTSGSGAVSWLGGWFNIFFPFMSNGQPNRFCQPYSAGADYVKAQHNQFYGMMSSQPRWGMEDDDMPSGLGSAPVTWEYHGTEIPLTFKAGLLAATQDKETGVVRPFSGWFIERLPADAK